jgi:hypothetical protein
MTHSFTKGVPIDTDGTLSLNSNQVVPSQAAVVTYVTNSVAAALASATDLHTAKLIVNPSGGAAGGNYTTIAAALTAAASGDTIFITPGTYTEDLTLKAGVNLCAYDCDALTPNVIILGKATATFAGTASLSGLQLKTASDYFLVVSGTAVTNINLKNCYLNCGVGRGINHTTTGASATLNIIDCRGDTPTAGASGTFWTEANSTTKIINVINTHISNSGGAIGYRTSSGTLNVVNSTFAHTCDCVSDAVVTLTNSTYNCSSLNAQAYTFNSSGAQIAYNCIFLGGTASAVGGSAAFSLFGCNISSSNTNAVTGGGTVTYAGLIFSGTSKKINTTTQVGGLLQGGLTQAPSAGFIGEQIRGFVTEGSAVNMGGSGVVTEITNISLTAGIWDISCAGVLNLNGATITGSILSINTTVANGTNGDNALYMFVGVAGISACCGSIPAYRVTLTATTTYRLVMVAVYTVATPKGSGRISATRVG